MKLSLKTLVISLLTFYSIGSCKKDPPPEVVPVTSSISLKNVLSWSFASVPLRFAESTLSNNTAYGFNRAKISWYNIDPKIFYDKSNTRRPFNITNDDMSADDCRVIYEKEFFPSREDQYSQPMILYMFNVDYYPAEKGAWNYDTEQSLFSAGIAFDGKLNQPETRWAGMMRRVETNEELRYNYLDFWILDPFTTYPDANGELVFDLGDISEDVLKDGLLSQENTKLENPISTVWGKVYPSSVVSAFPTNDYEHKFDTGLDELLNNAEYGYFSDYLDKIKSICDPLVYNSIFKDPANDDFDSYVGKDLDELNLKVRDRYKRINEYEKNSVESFELYVPAIQRGPNSEDINRNLVLDTLNNYYEYRIQINKQSLQIGTNYLVEVYTNPSPIKLENGKNSISKFYHFRIPMKSYTATYGYPNPSANPSFLRMYFTGFSSPINLRFINLDFSEEVIEYTH